MMHTDREKRGERQALAFIIIGALVLFLLLIVCRKADARVDITKAVIHHTASPEWTTVADIDRWHKERGWDEIGYHYVVRRDGQVKKGRSINKKGAHARGRNNKVGIALVGYDEFTDLQINAVNKLLARIGVQSIERHHKNCPGEGIKLEETL